MPPEEQNNGNGNISKAKKRPFTCTLVLAAALTYFIWLALLFIAALVFSGEVAETLSKYIGPEDPHPRKFNLFTLSGTLLFSASVAGIILMILKRKAGFYLFFTTALIIFILDLAFLNFDWLRYLIHSGFIFILGIMFFSRRCMF